PSSMIHRGSRLSTAALWAALILFDSAAQLLFKSAATHLPRPSPTLAWMLMVAQSWRAWLALACLLVTFGFWIAVLRRSKLSTAFPVTALTFIGVLTGSWWFFGETVQLVQYFGIALIVIGVAMLKPFES